MQTSLRHMGTGKCLAHTRTHRPPCSASHRNAPIRRKQIARVGDLLPALEPAQVQNAAYVTLGLTGLSFVATFFVAPQFKDQFKEDVDWRDIYRVLQSTGVKQVDASEAYAKSKSGGAVLVDVRLGNKYDALHAQGSINVPLYNPIQNWDLPSIIRRAGFAFFGIYGTELNTNFAEDMVRRVPRGKQVIVICENGGTLENKSGTKYGFQSRSLKAVYFLQQAGFKQVSYVKGGISQWARDKLPLADGPEDAAAAGFDDDDDDSDGGLRVGGLRLPQLTSVFSR